MVKKNDDKPVKQRLKVLILSVGPYDISPPWNEGTKNNQIAWIKYLKGQNIEFHIISTKAYELENTKIYSIPINIKTVFKKVWFTVRLSLLARKLCKNDEVDTITFAFTNYGILIPIIMLKGIDKRKILTLASERYLKKVEIFRISLFNIPYCLKKFIFHSFDGIICVSKKLKEELKKTKLIPEDEIFFFPAMPINISEWQPFANKRELRSKYGIKENEIILLHVGHFKKNRGVDVLLKSIASLKNENIKLFLIWNGRGNKNRIINTINKLRIDEKVKIMRKIDDIREIYSISDIFIFPQITQINIIEYPLTIIEAMLMANVVIATDHPSFRELVKENTGVVIPPNDVDALTTELLKLIKNPELRKDLAIAARDSILGLYGKQKPDSLVKFYKGNKEFT